MADLITLTALSILAAGFFVGIVVGLTGMGGGALMTPALIFLGVGEAATVVTADLTAAAIYKTGGAIVHKREGSPNMQLAKWLMIGSVPMALLGPHLVAVVHRRPEDLDDMLKLCIGFALLLAAATYALRLYINLLARARRRPTSPTTTRRSAPSRRCSSARSAACSSASPASAPGSVIMIALLMLYPGLSRGEAGRHRPRPGRPAGDGRRDLQHRPPRPRLGDPDPAGHRLGARHPPRLA